MRHVEALLMKLILFAVILELTLMNLTRLGFRNILVVSLTVTIVDYLIGDMLILRFTNNTIATISDIGISLLTIYLFDYFLYRPGITFTGAMIASVVIGIAQWFFHKLLIRLLHWEKIRRTVT